MKFRRMTKAKLIKLILFLALDLLLNILIKLVNKT